MNEFYSIRMTGEPSLQHWKYIKRIRSRKGKYRYYYDDSWQKKYDKGVTDVYKSKDGTTKISYTNSNDLFDSKSVTKLGRHSQNIVLRRGKLSRAQINGERFIFNRFYSKKNRFSSSPNKISRAASRGASFIKKVIGR